MKILILFEYANHYQTIDNLCNNLNKKGLEASSFNVAYWRFRNRLTKRVPLWIRIVSLLAKIPGVRGFLTSVFRYKALLGLADNYDIIDIHFFSPMYDKLILELKRRGKGVKITVWGHDLYMVDQNRREQQRRLYKVVDIIQTETQEIANDFLEVYPECEARMRVAHFGIIQFDIIDELMLNGNVEVYKKELGIPLDKIIITCGTNRSAGHQHLKMLDGIEHLVPELKEQLFLIIPMTYGGEKSYIQAVRQKVESIGIPHLILTSFLTLHDLSKLRMVSGLTITIQDSDALASAIQEYLYAGGILIAGNWLPYHALTERGIFFLRTSLEALSLTLTDSLNNYQSYRDKCNANREKLAEFSSWNNVIHSWLRVYDDIKI